MGLSGADRDRQRRLWWIASLVSVAGAGCLLLAVLLGGGPRYPLVLSLAFVVVFVGAELAPLHLTHEGSSESLRLEEALLVPMVLVLAPREVLGTVVLAVAVAALVNRRGWLKALFNTGLMAVSSGAGLLVAVAGGIDGTAGLRSLTAAVAGGLVFSVVSAVGVAGMIAVAQGERFASVLFEGAAVRVATWVGSLALGVLVAMAVVAEPWALGIAVVPAVVLQYAYSGAMRQWRERRQAEALWDAARRIHATIQGGGVQVELAAAARHLLSAGSAQVVSQASDVPGGALRADVDGELAVQVQDRATGGRWSAGDASRLHALAAIASGALDNARVYEQLHTITDSLGEGVLAFDAAGTITFANPAACEMLGWPAAGLIGLDVAEVDRDCRAGIPGGADEWAHLEALRAGRTLRLDEHGLTRRDGTVLDVALTASPVLQDGQLTGAVLAVRDVTERKALERRLVHQAFHDQLTGLPSRALFLDRLEHARTRGRDAGTTQAVLFIDVDRFKLINDSLGHRVGDDVLCTIASRLVGSVRDADTVARFGGDEFTVLLEEMTHPSEAAAAAERMLRALRAPVVAGDRTIVLSVSIGVAVAEPGNAPTDLLAAADIAMYEAKRTGKDRYCLAAADADEQALARLDLEMELRRAIEHDELELHYQPVLEAQGGRLYGFEALVRWQHPTLGLLPPSHFMELAEDTGLVLPLGEWVLERACRTARAWADDHPGQTAVMAVNLSARQFVDPDLCDRVSAVLQAVGLEPSSLVLEITETVVMGDTERTLATLRALKRLGVRLAIDDFGTGYSSLSYLKRFPVDVVKIDKSFVDGLGDSPVDREIVAAVIRLAAAVGMQTVAEGVETTGQLEQLRLLGCTLVQGYLLARPQPAAELDRVLAEAAVPSHRSRCRDAAK